MDIYNAILRHKEALQEEEAWELSVRQAQENYRIMQNRYMNQLAILTDLALLPPSREFRTGSPALQNL